MATRPVRNSRLAQNNSRLEKISNGGKKRALEQDDDEGQKKKRVFGDITNRDGIQQQGKKKVVKKVVAKKTLTRTAVAVARGKASSKENGIQSSQDSLPCSQSSVKSEDLSWEILELSQGSQGSSSSQESRGSSSSQESSDGGLFVSQIQLRKAALSEAAKVYLGQCSDNVDDVDTEHLRDPYQVALYAPYVFDYYKQRELKFQVTDFLSGQTELTPHMRAILVDWLVEVQENFELNHETLYLAVKLVDLYLTKHISSKEKLQLVGATSLFISCKFDERCPPMLDDFLYICDDAYKKGEIIKMEMEVLRAVDFDLGTPLSYRFLRRYAKCAGAAIVTLTLSRYILETSLMDYSFVQHRDSYRAAAALLLAMKMDSSGKWTKTMVHYSGYTETELLPLVSQFNSMVSAAASSKLSTIRVKYSHRIFHEVAKIPPLDVNEIHSPTPSKPTARADLTMDQTKL